MTIPEQRTEAARMDGSWGFVAGDNHVWFGGAVCEACELEL